jgi:hypothetical protein
MLVHKAKKQLGSEANYPYQTIKDPYKVVQPQKKQLL